MKMQRALLCLVTLVFTVLHVGLAIAQATDPLPSWNDGNAKRSIAAFVEKVATPGSPDFVPPAERIATFDNDGTLWAEKPVYFQLLFALDRAKELAPRHPEWKDKEPFASLLKGDVKSALGHGDEALLEIVMSTHAGMTTIEFEKTVKDWIATARHPEIRRPYAEMVYQPVLVRLPEVNFVDDKEGKPVGINSHIGRRPVAAFGNSDGDLQMLQWTTAGQGARFGLLVHHTDGEREWAYDEDSSVGRLDKALTEAEIKGWTVVDVKRDWKVIYPSDKK
jgi:hypothetical protein